MPLVHDPNGALNFTLLAINPCVLLPRRTQLKNRWAVRRLPLEVLPPTVMHRKSIARLVPLLFLALTQTGSMFTLLLGMPRLPTREQFYALPRRNMVLLSVNLEPVLLTAVSESRSVGAAELATHRLKTPPKPGTHALETAVGSRAIFRL